MNKIVLSPLILYEDMEGGWTQYQEKLYMVFCRDIKEAGLKFQGKNVMIRYQPIEFGKEEAFFHITCQDYDKVGREYQILEDVNGLGGSDNLLKRQMQEQE